MEEQHLKTGSETYSDAIANADNYMRWIVDIFRPHFGETLLEVGLGHGSFKKFLPSNLTYGGTDIDADAVDEASRTNPQDCFFQADIVDSTFDSQAQQSLSGLDTILCANVLEHIEDDEQAVHNMLAALPLGGKLLLYLPAHPQLYGRMDELAGHHRRYQTDDLLRIAQGNQVVVWSFINPIAAVGWWVNRRLRYDSLNDASINNQIEWFDKWILPMSRWTSRITAKHFGLSLYCVIEKSI
jgi:2-polyprenyl-3-methyl-5-hydroxy-6-metoxy-1,4-benzoquinol methylase